MGKGRKPDRHHTAQSVELLGYRRRDNLVVPQLFTLSPATPLCQDRYLAVAHRFWISKAEDSDVLKLRRRDLAALPDVCRWKHKDQNAAKFEPAIRVREKNPFRTFASRAPCGPVVKAVILATARMCMIQVQC